MQLPSSDEIIDDLAFFDDWEQPSSSIQNLQMNFWLKLEKFQNAWRGVTSYIHLTSLANLQNSFIA